MIGRALILLVFLTAIGSAVNLDVQVIPINPLFVPELGEPAVYNFIIHNNVGQEKVEIYTIVGINLVPKESFTLKTGRNSLIVEAYPNEHISKQRGYINFEYEIKGESSGVYKGKMSLKIVPLDELLEVKISPLRLDSKFANVSIRNLQSSNLSNIYFEINTPFFSGSEVLSFSPFEIQDLIVEIDSINKNLAAGPYLADISIGNGTTNADMSVGFSYLSDENIITSNLKEGWFYRESIVKKNNSGNTQVNGVFEIEVMRFTGAFTTFSEEPDNSKSDGLSTVYSWQKIIPPGQEKEVSVKVNYLLPIIVLILLGIGSWALWQFFKTDVSIRKRAIFVKTKGGEFALKIILTVTARRGVDNVVLHDYVPAVAKFYESYGRRPDSMDSNSRRLLWKIGNMSSGESRVFSYVIYSKVHTVGKFELPLASANYGKGDSAKHSYSNKAFVINEGVN